MFLNVRVFQTYAAKSQLSNIEHFLQVPGDKPYCLHACARSIMGDFDKSRKIAFLPGTSGIGKALAKNLAKAGYKILIGGAKLGEAKASVKEIQKAAGSACPFIEAMDMKGAAGAAKVIFFSMSGSQEEKKDLLQDLQSELKGKTIIDVTTAAYLKDESKWGQTSTTHMNQEALAVPAKWVRCWNTVFVGLLENPPPSDSPHNIIICGDDQDAVTDAKQLTDCLPGFKALYGGGLKYAKALDLLGPGWIVELDKNASNSMGSALAGWRFGL